MAKHIIIIGAGAVGLSAAYYCAKQGHRVTVMERHGPVRSGCSHGNAGMVVPSHFTPLAAPGMVALGIKWMWNPESPFYIKPRLDPDLLVWAARFWRAATPARAAAAAPVLRDILFLGRACFEELEAAGMDFGFEKLGLLMLCKTRHGLDEEAAMAAKANALGVPADVLDARATAAMDPGITMDVAGGVYFPKDCHLSPERLLGALQTEAMRLGVEFRWHTDVTGWRANGGTISAVETSQGNFSGDEFVLCGGVWSSGAARRLGVNLPMQAGNYSLTLKSPRQLPRLCAILTEARHVVMQLIFFTATIFFLIEPANERQIPH